MPEGGTVTTLPLRDGVPLRMFLLPHEDARARLLLLNGRADFLEKWARLFAELHAAGFALAAFDWRGQGGSGRLVPGDAGHIDSFDTWLADLDEVASFVDEALPGTAPWLMLGHSMGGHLLMRWLAARQASARLPGLSPWGAILTAPFVDFAIPSPLRQLLLGLARWEAAHGKGAAFAPGQGPWGPHREAPARMAILTSDRAQFEDEGRWIAAEPRLATGGVTWGWLAAAAESLDKLRSTSFAALDIPVLMLLAGRERLVSNPAALGLARRLPRVEVELLKDAAHEILREADPMRAEALSRIERFAATALP
ncbi:alpha/beta fold hydrolase [Thermaurantiacus sp.]